MGKKRVFVLLIGKKEQGDVNHFQLLQERDPERHATRLHETSSSRPIRVRTLT